jgi:hypothetical protein
MSRKSRIEDLEQQHEKDSITLDGVQWFHDGCIFVDGHHFESLEEIPQELRLKYPNLGTEDPEKAERMFQALAPFREACAKFPRFKEEHPAEYAKSLEDEKNHEIYVKQNQP